MYNMIKAEFYRCITSHGFLVSLISTIAVFLFGTTGMLSQDTSVVAAFNNIYKYNNITQMLFLTSTFAYSTSFCVDWQTNYIHMVVIRGKILPYLFGKFIVVGIMGGISVTLGAGLFMAYMCINQPMILPNAMEIDVEFSNQAFGDLLAMKQPALYFLSYLFVIFLQSAFWSTLGLCVSSFLPNKHAAYAGPFILAFIINSFANASRLPVWIDPVKMSTVPITATPFNRILLLMTGIYLSFIVINNIVFIKRAKRRICND